MACALAAALAPMLAWVGSSEAGGIPVECEGIDVGRPDGWLGDWLGGPPA